MKLQFKKTELAKRLESPTTLRLNFTPEKGTRGSVGYDLKACIEKPINIFPGQVVKIGSGVHINIQESLAKEDNPECMSIFGWLTPRSSINGLRLENTNGIIDTDYQGELIFKVRNSSEEVKTISPGDRFIQLLFIPVFIPELCEVDEFENITTRGEGGFGSTGKI